MSTILVVDDEPPIRELVRDTLEIEGHDVAEAPDGPTALDIVAENPPDLMVLDIMMPGMSGLDVLRTLRRDRSGYDLPIILLTAAADDDTTWAGWTAGASVFLPKPFDPSHLVDWVERLLDTSEEEQLAEGEASTPPDVTATAEPEGLAGSDG